MEPREKNDDPLMSQNIVDSTQPAKGYVYEGAPWRNVIGPRLLQLGGLPLAEHRPGGFLHFFLLVSLQNVGTLRMAQEIFLRNNRDAHCSA